MLFVVAMPATDPFWLGVKPPLDWPLPAPGCSCIPWSWKLSRGAKLELTGWPATVPVTCTLGTTAIV